MSAITDRAYLVKWSKLWDISHTGYTTAASTGCLRALWEVHTGRSATFIMFKTYAGGGTQTSESRTLRIGY